MSEKVSTKIADYQIFEWDVASFVEGCGTIIATNSHHIHRIRLNKTEEVYLIPRDFYLAAKSALKETKNNNKL